MVQQGGRVLEVRSIQVHQKHLKLCLYPEFQGNRRYINIHKHVWRFSKTSVLSKQSSLALIHESNLDTRK